MNTIFEVIQKLEALRDSGKLETAEADGMLQQIQTLIDQYNKQAKLLSQMSGINAPFICGGSEDKDEMGLSKTIFVCPAYGLDGFAIYKLSSPYSAPGY